MKHVLTRKSQINARFEKVHECRKMVVPLIDRPEPKRAMQQRAMHQHQASDQKRATQKRAMHQQKGSYNEKSDTMLFR